MTKRRPATYEEVVLQALISDWRDTGPEETAARISARLKRGKLGGYDAERVDRLRRFHEDLRDEVGKWTNSEYYTYRHGKYSGTEDFDVPRLTRDMISRHPNVSKEFVEEFVPFAVYLYYLR